jgi:glucose-1-phosphate adenylyltransferase
MIELLADNPGNDFGKQIIPDAIKSHKVAAYIFDGFWEDIGTIRRFYEVNLEMTTSRPSFDFFQSDRPIYTHARFLPPSEVHGSRLADVLLADGCKIKDAVINNSVIGLRSIIGSGVNIRRSVLIDKNARIGKNVSIRFKYDRQDSETRNWVAKEGLVIVPKNAIIRDGTVI